MEATEAEVAGAAGPLGVENRSLRAGDDDGTYEPCTLDRERVRVTASVLGKSEEHRNEFEVQLTNSFDTAAEVTISVGIFSSSQDEETALAPVQLAPGSQAEVAIDLRATQARLTPLDVPGHVYLTLDTTFADGTREVRQSVIWSTIEITRTGCFRAVKLSIRRARTSATPSQGTAAREGFSSFYAADAFNSHRDGADCWIDIGRFGAFPCRDGDNKFYPKKLMETNYNAVPETGNETDWARAFWKLHTHSSEDADLNDMLDWMNEARDNMDSGNAYEVLLQAADPYGWRSEWIEVGEPTASTGTRCKPTQSKPACGDGGTHHHHNA